MYFSRPNVGSIVVDPPLFLSNYYEKFAWFVYVEWFALLSITKIPICNSMALPSGIYGQIASRSRLALEDITVEEGVIDTE